eukprot:9997613-Alexandrium_andersonii.AAC.1
MGLQRHGIDEVPEELSSARDLLAPGVRDDRGARVQELVARVAVVALAGAAALGVDEADRARQR